MYNFTQDQIRELAKCSQNYIYCLLKYVKIVHPKHGEVQFELFDFQKKLLKHYIDNRLSIALLSRQMGKTTTAAGYLLCEAIFKKDQTILITSNKLSGAKEVIDRIRKMYMSMPDFLKPKMDLDNKTELGFTNGSKIVARATTKDAGVGLSISILYMDELSRVPNNICEEFFEAIMPVVSTGGKVIITSTPKGDSNMFYYLWRDAYIRKKSDYKPIYIHWSEHPDRTPEWAVTERRRMKDDAKWEQEFECSFLSNASTIIDLKLLDKLKTLTRPKIDMVPSALANPNWEVYKLVEPDREYFISIDSSEGGGNDNAVINVFDDKLEQVAVYIDNYTDESELAKHAYMASQYYNEAMIYVESESTGKAVCLALENGYEIGERLARTKPSARAGFPMTQKRRNDGISAARQYIKNHKLKLNSHKVIDEFRFFKRKEGSRRYEAEFGTKDDCVMSIVLLCSEIDKIASSSDEVSNILYDVSDDDLDFKIIDEDGEERDDYEPVNWVVEDKNKDDFSWV